MSKVGLGETLAAEFLVAKQVEKSKISDAVNTAFDRLGPALQKLVGEGTNPFLGRSDLDGDWYRVGTDGQLNKQSYIWHDDPNSPHDGYTTPATIPKNARTDAMPELKFVKGLLLPELAEDPAKLARNVEELRQAFKDQGFTLIGFGKCDVNDSTPYAVYTSDAMDRAAAQG